MKKCKGLFLAAILSGCTTLPTAPPIPFQKKLTYTYTKDTKNAIDTELLKQKSAEARQMLSRVFVGPYCVKDRVIKGRQIALAIYSPQENVIEIVRLGLCYEQPKNLTPLTPNFGIQWIAGRGITHFAFSAIDTLHGNHILLDKKEWMRETNTGEYYFPFTHDFLRWEFVEDGTKFILAAIREAQEELCSLNVRSRAFPDKKLCEVFPDDLPLNVKLIEQMDDEEFLGTCPETSALPAENRIFKNCKEYSTFKVLVHYARNTQNAFHYVGSSAGAIGPAQFTRRTYDDIAFRRCPDAQLIQSFEIGARNLKNAIKAEICLLDLELSQMPPKARELFLFDYRKGGLYPIVAYNGGHQRAWCVFYQNKQSRNCRATSRAWHETEGYMTKYQESWSTIDLLKKRITQDR